MLGIGNLAKRVGLRASAIRYYEKQGIVVPSARARNGYRIYSDEAVERLQFVRRAQSLGITLKEIKPLLNLVARGQQPCSHIKQLARTHLGEIEDKIQELQLLQNELRRLLRRKISRSHRGQVCPIIELSNRVKLEGEDGRRSTPNLVLPRWRFAKRDFDSRQ